MRSTWASRILLEASQHAESAFLTLTYSDGALEEKNVTTQWVRRTTEGLPTLTPRDLTLFMKRLREEIAPKKIRFYAVGEYGDQTERPHW